MVNLSPFRHAAAKYRRGEHPRTGVLVNFNDHGDLLVGPDWWLREVEAKRAIVALGNAAEAAGFGGEFFVGESHGYENAVRALAAVYADHPDYREEWKP